LSESPDDELLSVSGVLANLRRITLASIGQIPVASKAFNMRLSVKEDIQALQKSGKKSSFLIGMRP
jgi:hypothetical protein